MGLNAEFAAPALPVPAHSGRTRYPVERVPVSAESAAGGCIEAPSCASYKSDDKRRHAQDTAASTGQGEASGEPVGAAHPTKWSGAAGGQHVRVATPPRTANQWGRVQVT